MDISHDDSSGIFAVGAKGTGNIIFMRSSSVSIPGRASEAPPAWPFWKAPRKLQSNLM